MSDSLSCYSVAKDLVTFVGAAITVWLALRSWQQSTEEARHLRQWKQAEKGRELIQDLFEADDEDSEYYAWDAMRMLDYADALSPYSSKPVGKNHTRIEVTPDKIRKALDATVNWRDPDPAADEESLYIRESFDELYFKMAQLQDAIENELIEFRNVQFSLTYYVQRMAKTKEDAALHREYLKHYGYEKTLAFLEQFEAWNST